MCNFIVHQITRVRQSSLKLEAKRKQMKRDMHARVYMCVCVCVLFLGGGRGGRFVVSAIRLEKFLIELRTPLHIVE